jgi:hypothetical protein
MQLSSAPVGSSHSEDVEKHRKVLEFRPATPPVSVEDRNNFLDTGSDDDDEDIAYIERNTRLKYRKQQPSNNVSHNMVQSPPSKKMLAAPLLNAYGVPVAFASHSGNKSSAPKSTVDLSERIRVCVRKRPLNKKETKSNQADICSVTSRRTIVIHEPKYVKAAN